MTLSPDLLIYGTEEDSYRLLHPDVVTHRDGSEYVYFSQQTAYRRVLDMKKDNPTAKLTIPPEGLILKPWQLYLGSSVERTETRGFVPQIETRSSVARLGITAHLSAGVGETGFRGTFTLEIVAFEPVRVYANVRICQILYSRLDGREVAYTGKYFEQSGPVPSRLFRDFLPREEP